MARLGLPQGHVDRDVRLPVPFSQTWHCAGMRSARFHSSFESVFGGWNASPGGGQTGWRLAISMKPAITPPARLSYRQSGTVFAGRRRLVARHGIQSAACRDPAPPAGLSLFRRTCWDQLLEAGQAHLPPPARPGLPLARANHQCAWHADWPSGDGQPDLRLHRTGEDHIRRDGSTRRNYRQTSPSLSAYAIDARSEHQACESRVRALQTIDTTGWYAIRVVIATVVQPLSGLP